MHGMDWSTLVPCALRAAPLKQEQSRAHPVKKLHKLDKTSGQELFLSPQDVVWAPRLSDGLRAQGVTGCVRKVGWQAPRPRRP